MNQAEVIALRRHEDRRLGQHGHNVKWRKSGAVWRGTCLNCGGRPSLLRWPGVNMIAPCPGGAR